MTVVEPIEARKRGALERISAALGRLRVREIEDDHEALHGLVDADAVARMEAVAERLEKVAEQLEQLLAP